MSMIRPMLFAALMLASMLASAQSATNNPPKPGNNTPPVPCGTGGQLGCEWSPRGYLLRNCPIITTEGGGPINGLQPPFTQTLCELPTEPPKPYMECQEFPGYVICEGFPSGSDEMTFQWSVPADLRNITITNIGDEKGRMVRLTCSASWSGRIDLRVTNTINGTWATDFANISCQIPTTDSAEL